MRGIAWAWPVVVGAMTAVVPMSMAQEVAPRLTGAVVLDHLGKLVQAVDARAKAAPDAKLDAVAAQLSGMASSLQGLLGGNAGEPVATIGAGQRDAVMRADAGARRVQAWLDASAVGCTRDDVDAMLAALAVTLDHLAHDTASQKAPLPILDGVETLDRQPLFVLRPGTEVLRFVLTGKNLVDLQCANPKIVAMDAAGHPAAVQPQLVAAQPTRIELRWPDAAKLAPGSYLLQVTAQRKGFLVGCVAEPPAVMAVQVAAPPTFTVGYTVSAICPGNPAPEPMGSGALALADYGQAVSRRVDAARCPAPTAYTLTATVQAGNEAPRQVGPTTQGADASSTLGLGNGVTLAWDPALHQVLAHLGAQSCKGVH